MSRDTTGPIFYPQTNKPYFPPKFGGDVLKLAVRLDYGMKNYFPNLLLNSKEATKFIEFRQVILFIYLNSVIFVNLC